MDWLKEIGEFPKFNIIKNYHATPDDASKVLSKYNKALFNATNDSIDIAIIELRKLSLLYPEYGQINVLHGCCLAMEGRYGDAIQAFEKARAKELSGYLGSRIDSYIEEAIHAKARIETNPSGRSYHNKPARPAPEIIAADPSKWKQRKEASAREKRDILRRENLPNSGEKIKIPSLSVNWLKLLLTTLAIIAAVGIISIGIFVIPKIANMIQSENNAGNQLKWLLGELEKVRDSDSSIDDLLIRFDDKFYNGSASSSAVSDEPTPTQSNVTPSPSPTPEPTISDIIIDANDKITQASVIGRDNPKEVMDSINYVRDALEGIDEATTAEGLNVNVGDILVSAANLEKSIVNPACYAYYTEGKNRFAAGEFQAAVTAYKSAFDINPAYLDGGNAYNLGKAYAEVGEQALANACFQYVIDNYPGTDKAGWAAARIVPIITDTE